MERILASLGYKNTIFFEAPQQSNEKAIKNNNAHKIALPHIEITHAKQFINVYAQRYNTRAHINREIAKAQGQKVCGIEQYQTLRHQHIDLMKRLAEMASYQCDFDNLHLSIHERAALAPEAGYNLFTSTRFLAKDRKTSERSIQRCLRRLHTCGFIVDRVSHGTRAQYELVINTNILPIHDLQDPEYEPKLLLPKGQSEGCTQTVQCAFPKRLTTKWRHSAPLKEPYNNIIKDERNCEQVHNAKLRDAGASPTEPQQNQGNQKHPKGTPEDSHHQGTKGQIAPGPRENSRPARPVKAALRQMCTQKGKVNTAKKAGGLQNYVYCQVYLFLQAAMQVLWYDREIFEGAQRNAEQYIQDHYFQGCRSEEQIDIRIAEMHRIMQVTAAFKAKNPEHRFVKMPNQYFNLSGNVKKGDYSNFKGAAQLIKERKELDKKKRSKYKYNRDLHDLRRWIKTYQKRPTIGKSHKLIKQVETKCPAMLPLLENYFVTGNMPKAPEATD